MVMYEITVMDSDSWSGQSYWTERFDTYEAAKARIKAINSFNTSATAPDYYMQAKPVIRAVD